MKTLAEVKKQETDLINLGGTLVNSSDPEDKKELKRVKSTINKLRPIKLYLETNPSEEGLIKELERLNKKGDDIDDRFEEWFLNTPQAKRMSNPKKVFYDTTGISEINKKIATLKFILNK